MLNGLTAFWPHSYTCLFPRCHMRSIMLNELTPGLDGKVAPTDCRLRPDQHCLELGQYDQVGLVGGCFSCNIECMGPTDTAALAPDSKRGQMRLDGCGCFDLPPPLSHACPCCHPSPPHTGQPREAAAGAQAARGAQGGGAGGPHPPTLVRPSTRCLCTPMAASV